jgi:hypothetical protein
LKPAAQNGRKIVNGIHSNGKGRTRSKRPRTR